MNVRATGDRTRLLRFRSPSPLPLLHEGTSQNLEVFNDFRVNYNIIHTDTVNPDFISMFYHLLSVI